MKLIYSPTSPYARKVRVAIIEYGLEGRVTLVPVNPLEPGAEAEIPNPLGKVPTLVLDDGVALYDSPVICQYLLELSGGPPPAWADLRRQALGDGVIDAAFNAVMERRRPAEQQSPMWLERWEAAIVRSLAAMEAEADKLDAELGLVEINWACAMGYLDFRLEHLAWRERCARLAAWHQSIADRPAMLQTSPG